VTVLAGGLDRSYDIKTSLIRDKSYVGKKIA
jgi:hypothetical protein